MSVKRNSIGGMEPGSGDEGEVETVTTITNGGGGSAEGPSPPPPGVGYPETCTGSEPEKKGAQPDGGDDWLALLAASGVGEAWVRVARRIGFEAFMAMWSELDRDEGLLDERRRLRVPQLSATLFRVQRAQIIRQLGDQGKTPPEIVAALPRRLRGRISRRTVLRILRAR